MYNGVLRKRKEKKQPQFLNTFGFNFTRDSPKCQPSVIGRSDTEVILGQSEILIFL
jgi:hypothetical protein